MSRYHANNLGAPGYTPYHHAAAALGDDSSESSLGVEAPPESPLISEADFFYTPEDGESPSASPVARTATLKTEKEPYVQHPDSVIREEVFNQLAFCGFLDIRQAFLFRWAVSVVWSMHIFRQT